MESAEFSTCLGQTQSHSNVIQLSHNHYQFILNGLTGSITIHSGANLSQQTIRCIQQGRRTYRIWSLPEYESDILKLDAHDLNQNGWLSWHVLTEYGGRIHTVSAYMPDPGCNKQPGVPLEFDIWKIRRQQQGHDTSLWDAFAKLSRDGNKNPESNYLILHRLAISQKEGMNTAPYASQICFATSQLALEHYLRDKPFNWVVSQQRRELSRHLHIDKAFPLFTPASDTLGLRISESLCFDPDHMGLRKLHKRYPGYWHDHEYLERSIKQFVQQEKYASVFHTLWEQMREDGIQLRKGREVNQLIRPRNLKYLSLAFSASPELFDSCSRESAPGPFCSITKRHDWFESCANIFNSAHMG